MTASAGEDNAARLLGNRFDLTPAELRVLRFLPSHLSLPEIAAELYVSSNTVKTQSQAAYRKLGVSSRRDAVDQVGRAGLLGSGADRGT